MGKRVVASVAFSLTLILLTACGKVLYTKPGATSQDFEQDKFECENKLGIASAVGDPTDKLAYWMVRGREDMDRCLRSKGWGRQER